jgi:hypothetical protein
MCQRRIIPNIRMIGAGRRTPGLPDLPTRCWPLRDVPAKPDLHRSFISWDTMSTMETLIYTLSFRSDRIYIEGQACRQKDVTAVPEPTAKHAQSPPDWVRARAIWRRYGGSRSSLSSLVFVFERPGKTTKP